MVTNLVDELRETPVVPLVQSDEPEIAVAIARALAAGGLRTIEVVFRTERARECLAAIAAESMDVFLGAGTILNAGQVETALAAGAQFIVSPGLDDGVVRAAQAADAPVFPGTATASEVQRAVNLGLDVVKFFPASIAGGPAAIKAISSAFGGVRFMPTGGVSARNLADYLAVPSVLACGGSWLTPRDAVESGNFERITELAEEALTIARR